jgi:hypothetical protein
LDNDPSPEEIFNKLREKTVEADIQIPEMANRSNISLTSYNTKYSSI